MRDLALSRSCTALTVVPTLSTISTAEQTMKRTIDLSGQDLSGKSFRGEDLSYADLRDALLYGTDLSMASLYGANMAGVRVDESTNFSHADLRKTLGTPMIPMVCPSHGPFIAWKMANNHGPVLVKLLVPGDAKRVSGTTRACRCDKAHVIEIEGADEAYSFNDPSFVYRVGEYVYADSFDDDRWNNWSHGIYFFIDREEAERYRVWT